MAPVTLDSFGISKNAFLPAAPPLSCLPDAYYEPWEAIAENLPALIRHRQLRNQVKELPILNTDRLITEPEWRRAYVALSYISHAYIWGGETPEEILPAQLAIPLLAVSTYVELPPVLTCAAVNIWNYKTQTRDTNTKANTDSTTTSSTCITTSNLTDPDSLAISTTFTGTESEIWFQKIGTAIEAHGASIMDTLLVALHAVHTHTPENDQRSTIALALNQLQTCLRRVTATLERMHEHCDPLTFCHQIRPFYAGSRNLQRAGLPRGVFYTSDAATGAGEWLQLPGGSNGQSALMQLFDVVLGLGLSGGCTRNNNNNKDDDDYYLNTRACTPGPHRRFLAWAAHMGSIRALALRRECDASGINSKERQQQRKLKKAFAGAAAALSEFRTKHIQIVARYIAMPLKKPWFGSVQSQTLPILLPSGLGDDGSKGTAGTTMLEFLKGLRNETAKTASLAD